MSSTNTSREFQCCILIIGIGFLCGTVFAFFMRHHGWPYNTFLFIPSQRFSDFFMTYAFTKGLNPYTSPIAFYFPLAYWVIVPFTLIRAKYSFVIFNLIFCGFLFWLLVHYTRNFKTSFKPFCYFLMLFVFYLSYPVLMCLDRGNFEAMLFIFVALFLISFQKHQYYVAALLLSIAIGMKGFPAVFLVLFIKEKKYKELFFCIILTLVLTLSALASLKGGIVENIHLYSHVMGNAKHDYVLWPVIYGTASLFQIIKFVIGYVAMEDHAFYWHEVTRVLPIYEIAVGIFFVVLAVYIVRYERVFWKNVVLLVFAMIIFPTISYDYKLIYLLLPLLLFFQRPYDAISRFDRAYLILLSLLFIPKHYYVIPIAVAPINNLINIAIMFILMGLIFCDYFQDKRCQKFTLGV